MNIAPANPTGQRRGSLLAATFWFHRRLRDDRSSKSFAPTMPMSNSQPLPRLPLANLCFVPAKLWVKGQLKESRIRRDQRVEGDSGLYRPCCRPAFGQVAAAGARRGSMHERIENPIGRMTAVSSSRSLPRSVPAEHTARSSSTAWLGDMVLS